MRISYRRWKQRQNDIISTMERLELYPTYPKPTLRRYIRSELNHIKYLVNYRRNHDGDIVQGAKG